MIENIELVERLNQYCNRRRIGMNEEITIELLMDFFNYFYDKSILEYSNGIYKLKGENVYFRKQDIGKERVEFYFYSDDFIVK